MIRIGLCDDSRIFLNKTIELIENWDAKPQNITLNAYEDGDSLLKAHQSDPFDILILDILMPLFNGLELAKEIREFDKNVKIIFLTTSMEFAVDSYSVKANNYILKPLSTPPDRLYTALSDLIYEITKEAKCISIKSLNTTYKVNISNIEYVEAQGKSICIMLNDKNKLSGTSQFHVIEEELSTDPAFFKCHRSYIVNMAYIDCFTPKEIKLQSGMCLPIARNRFKDFEEAYFATVFGKAGESK